jgi:predicted GH43/DUF377 family glycosyl hydrolase
MDYEVGTNPRWPCWRNNTVFITSMVPVGGAGEDLFRVWYGAADANVATALVSITQLTG